MKIFYFQYFQFLSLLLAIVYSKGLREFKLDLFIPLLVIVCVTEFIGGNALYFGWENNNLVYNCYLIISFPVTYYIFYKMLGYTGWARTLFFVSGAMVPLFFLVNLFFIQGLDHFNTYSFILYEFVTAILSLLLLLKLFIDDDLSIMLYEHPHFVISGGMLIFSISALVILGLHQYIQANKIQINGKNLYRVLMPIINVVLYSSYSYAFYLCSKLTRKLS